MPSNSSSRLPHGRYLFALSILCLSAIGCEPEMPMPPPRESKSPAEDDFRWAMERMEHAIDHFQPASSLGLSVKRELDYELIPPAQPGDNYRARVTIAIKTIYRPDKPTPKEKPSSDENGLKLDNPFGLPEGSTPGAEQLPGSEIPPAEMPSRVAPDLRIPTQELDEKENYLLEYVDNQWRLQSDDLEDHERMWFDYALQQGEFAPQSGTND